MEQGSRKSISEIKKFYDELLKSDDKIILDDILNKLDETSKYVLKSHYGIGCEPKTLKDIAKDINYTREGVRILHNNIIKKLNKKYV